LSNNEDDFIWDGTTSRHDNDGLITLRNNKELKKFQNLMTPSIRDNFENRKEKLTASIRN